MIFLYLFYTFCKIGLFGFGGGYAMLSMIQGEVVTRYNLGQCQRIYRYHRYQPDDTRPHWYQLCYLCGKVIDYQCDICNIDKIALILDYFHYLCGQ